ncbi:hypothetical protein PISL3812_01271 [Talaromyces islandicus]|uniref:Uncharacterized protein n=1 Tax=Talaromyces islandicus TaxID=28573 RepID=A0A0U1LLT7_TALIS|nr:hypothetical protein PISL3812_01271 [Talaromyces islandicus]
MDTNKDLTAQTIFGIKGLVAVITNGATGIGLMAAHTLVANGARVYIVSRRQDYLQKAAETVNAGSSGGGKVVPITADISQTDGVRSISSELTRLEPNGINILVNNGNVSPEERARSEAHNIDFSDANAVSKWMTTDGPDAWKDAYSGNIASHHFLTAALLPLLDKGRQQTPGHSSAIINIASAAGLTKTHSHGQFAFSSTKAAFIHLTKEWAHTFLPLRVRVNCIAPGIFPLIFPGEDVRDDGQKERLERVGHEIPAGRPGKETDIGAAILYLCSTAGTYVNGQILYLDGGILLKTPSTV